AVDRVPPGDHESSPAVLERAIPLDAEVTPAELEAVVPVANRLAPRAAVPGARHLEAVAVVLGREHVRGGDERAGERLDPDAEGPHRAGSLQVEPASAARHLDTDPLAAPLEGSAGERQLGRGVPAQVDDEPRAVARVLRDRVPVTERAAADQHVAAIAGDGRAAPVDVVPAAPRAGRRRAGEEETRERDDGGKPHASMATQQPLCPWAPGWRRPEPQRARGSWGDAMRSAVGGGTAGIARCCGMVGPSNQHPLALVRRPGAGQTT